MAEPAKPTAAKRLHDAAAVAAATHATDHAMLVPAGHLHSPQPRFQRDSRGYGNGLGTRAMAQLALRAAAPAVGAAASTQHYAVLHTAGGTDQSPLCGRPACRLALASPPAHRYRSWLTTVGTKDRPTIGLAWVTNRPTIQGRAGAAGAASDVVAEAAGRGECVAPPAPAAAFAINRNKVLLSGRDATNRMAAQAK